MLSEQQKLTKSMGLGIKITEAKDIDVILEHIFYKLRKPIKADAGAIYICL